MKMWHTNFIDPTTNRKNKYNLISDRGYSITTWTIWGGEGVKNVCFCPCSGYKNCPHRGGGGQKKICPHSCWMTHTYLNVLKMVNLKTQICTFKIIPFTKRIIFTSNSSNQKLYNYVYQTGSVPCWKMLRLLRLN